jgi:hypothetical protein
MNQAETVRVTVEILLERDQIAGTVQEPGGHGAHFDGWIGLISALERCRTGGLGVEEGEQE